MYYIYRIRGGQPPNEGGTLTVSTVKQLAVWVEPGKPNPTQLDFDRITDLLQEFRDEGAIIETQRKTERWWELLFTH